MLLTPSTNTVRNVSGVRFRSAVAGTPARIVAQLTGPEDPQLGAGTSFSAILSAAGAVGDVLTGAIFDYAGSAAPQGYLLCDGSPISRTDFAALFAVIGTVYGAGDGSTTFNIPDLRGRVSVGVGTNAAVSARALSDGVAVANRRPQHRHSNHSHGAGTYNIPSGGPTSGGSLNTSERTTAPSSLGIAGTSAAADGGSGNVNDSLDAPAFIVVNKIIKT